MSFKLNEIEKWIRK